MRSVFVLHHSYELDFCEETKLIGIYTTSAFATAAIERLKIQPGFRDRQDDFSISEYVIDKDNWTEGYVSMITIELKNKAGNWMPVEAELLIDGTYQIIEQPDLELTGEFQSLDIVRCIEISNKLRAVELVRRP